jgi:transposase
VRRDPRLFGIANTRWTLKAIHQVCDWLHLGSRPGLSQLLARLALSWKGARLHLRSPDRDYDAKRALIRQLGLQVKQTSGRLALVYLDEFTLHRQPSRANAWGERGADDPRAELSYRSDTVTRIVATLDQQDGRVTYRRVQKVGTDALVTLYRRLVRTYPQAERIYVVQDNWPIHSHPEVLVALEPQENPWPWHRPSNWPTAPSEHAQAKYGKLHLPIQLVMLPTYASWLNPIEKLWRKLKADLLHLHRLADRLDELRQEVDRFLDQFANGSLDLLRYVGLFVPD